MFALLFSYFNRNRIAIECLDFAAVALNCLKNSLITKIQAEDMEEKVELCGVKLSLSYKMLLIIIKEFETESVIKGYHAYMNYWTPIKIYQHILNRKIKLINMMWLLLKTHG